MGIVIRQSIKGTIVTYIGAFIGFLTTLFIIPKFIGEELYGLTRVLLEAGLLLAAIFQLGASASAMRFFPHFKSEDKQNNGFFFYLIALTSIGFLLFIPLFFLLKEPISNYFDNKSPLFVNYVQWLIPLTFFVLYWLTFEVYSNVLMRIAVPKFIREVLIRILTIVVYIAYALGFIAIDGFVAGFVCVYGVAMITSFFYVSSIGSTSLTHDSRFITKSLKKDFLSYTSIVLLSSLGGSVVGKIDVFMITGEIGLASTGIYSIAFYMISIVDIPSRSITSISSPLAALALQEGNLNKANDLYKKVSLHQLMIGSIIFLLIWININSIYAIIPNGENYIAGKWVVLFIGLAKLIEVTLNFGGVLISFSKYYHWSLYFLFFISGLTILLNYLLIPIFGISGAACATALTCLLSYGAQQWLIFNKIKANPYSSSTLKLLLIIGGMFGLNYLIPTLANPYIDIVFRTTIIGLLSMGLIYFLKISKEANLLFDNRIKPIIKSIIRK